MYMRDLIWAAVFVIILNIVCVCDNERLRAVSCLAWCIFSVAPGQRPTHLSDTSCLLVLCDLHRVAKLVLTIEPSSERDSQLFYRSFFTSYDASEQCSSYICSFCFLIISGTIFFLISCFVYVVNNLALTLCSSNRV